ncbi:MAG: hypothetical protein M0Z51_16840 [Propionibacterium sp.]|nr:hypothetical protein [Propionibacterium sp.]
MHVLDWLRDMGWIVVEVEGLAVAVALVRRLDVILVRSDASAEELARAADHLLLDAPRVPHG